ncbi:MAG: class D sortase [Vallitaleaceae bacterium]|nr:class D sortase [Vallitaleaceae bacterium]
MKRHIGTLLIVVGLLIIAFPFIGKYIADQRQKDMLEQFYLENEKTEDQVVDAYDSLSTIFDETNTQEGQEELDGIINSLNLDQSEENVDIELGTAITMGDAPTAIGVIRIDKIDLVAPIAEGADEDTLRYSIGHMEETAKLGTIGNAVVAGHRSHSFGIYFNRLDEVEVGDEIVVETEYETITYVVYKTLIVKPEDVSVLRNSSKYRVLTLVTCDPVYNPTHRLIVHAIDKSQQ